MARRNEHAPIIPSRRDPMKQGFIKRAPIENIMWAPGNRRELAEALATMVNELPERAWAWFWGNLTANEAHQAMTIQESFSHSLMGSMDVHYSMFPGGAASFSPYYDHPFHEDFDNEDEVLPPYLRDFRNVMIRRPDLPMAAAEGTYSADRRGIPMTAAELTALAYDYGSQVPKGLIGTVWSRAYSLFGEAMMQPEWVWDPSLKEYDTRTGEPVMDSKVGQRGAKSLGHAYEREGKSISDDVGRSGWSDFTQGEKVTAQRFLESRGSRMSVKNSSVRKRINALSKSLVREAALSKSLIRGSQSQEGELKNFSLQHVAAGDLICLARSERSDLLHEHLLNDSPLLKAVPRLEEVLKTISEDIAGIWDTQGVLEESAQIKREIEKTPEIIQNYSFFSRVLKEDLLRPLTEDSVSYALKGVSAVVRPNGIRLSDVKPLTEAIVDGSLFAGALDGPKSIRKAILETLEPLDLPYPAAQLADKLTPTITNSIHRFSEALSEKILARWSEKSASEKTSSIANAAFE